MTNPSNCEHCGEILPPDAPEGLCPKCLIGQALMVSATPRKPRNNDWNLLFGVLAVQLHFVTPAQLMEIAAAWATDPSRDLPERLVDAELLTEDDCSFVCEGVERTVKAHGGNVSESLASFGGDAQVDESFCGSVIRDAKGQVSPAPHRYARSKDISSEGLRETPGRYSQRAEYSRGGMGRILLVEDQYLGRDIALKELLPPSQGKSSGENLSPVRQAVPLMGRFLQEARITGQLEHPSIVPVYELGHRSDGTLYYTMKLVRGETLSQVLKQATSLQARLALLPHFVDLCQAIAYAHSRGVIHRDIKPANVMVGEFGETVVIDWGLAKAKDRIDIHAQDLEKTYHAMRMDSTAGTDDTAYGIALGTPAYMSPEQAQGKLESVDARSDVYALGAVLYELLTGRAPYTGKSTQEVIRKVINGRREPVLTLEKETPPELAAICERAMAQAPEKRYSSAIALADEIQRFLSGALVQAYSYHFTEHLRRFVARNYKVIGTAAVALILCLGLGVYSYISIYQARNDERVARLGEQAQRERAEYSRYVANIRVAAHSIEIGNTGLAQQALDTAPDQYRNWEWGYLVGQAWPDKPDVYANQRPIKSILDGESTASIWDGAEGRVIAVLPEDTVYTVRFSPDGQNVLTLGVGVVSIWDVTSGKKLFELERTADFLDATYLHDGTHIFSLDKNGSAVLWDASTGASLRVLPSFFGAMVPFTPRIQISPDDSMVAMVDSDSIKVWHISDGEMLCEIPIDADPQHMRYSFGADSSSLLIMRKLNQITTYSLSERAEKRTVKDVSGELFFVSGINGEAQFIGSIGTSGDALIWHAESGAESCRYQGDFQKDVCFSSDGTCASLVIGTDTIHLINTKTGKHLAVLSGFAKLVRQQELGGHGPFVSFSSDGSRFAVIAESTEGKRACLVIAPALAKTRVPEILIGHTDATFQIDISKDGSQVVTGSYDGTARIWNVETRTEQTILEGHAAEIWLVHFSPDASLVFTASWDRTARLWNAKSGAEIAFYDMGWPSRTWWGGPGSNAITEHGTRITHNRFSPDSSRCVIPGKANILVVDTDTGDTILNLPMQDTHVIGAEYSADGKLILAYAPFGSVHVWDADTGSEKYTIEVDLLQYAQFSYDSTKILLATTGYITQYIFDAQTGNELRSIQLYEEGSFASIDPVTGYFIGRKSIVDLETLQPIHISPGLDHHGMGLGHPGVFSPDGTRVLEKNQGGGIQIWDLKGNQLLTIKCPGLVLQARWLPDSSSIITSSSISLTPTDRNEIKFWDCIPWSELKDFGDASSSTGERVELWRKAQAAALQ